jgi:hypothetical protein
MLGREVMFERRKKRKRRRRKRIFIVIECNFASVRISKSNFLSEGYRERKKRVPVNIV